MVLHGVAWVVLILAFLYGQRDQVIFSKPLIPNSLPARKGSGRSVDVGLSLGARPFLKVAVVGGMPVLLEVDERLATVFN